MRANTLRKHGIKPAPPRAPDSATSGARAELIAIQKEIVARLKREIEDSFGGLPPAVQVYYDEYWREISSFERLASRQELLRACAAADLVYLGDYHTLRQSQQTAHWLLGELAGHGRPIVVCMEMVPSTHQPVLDAYQAGALTEQEFLAAIDYTNTWDFHWEPYRELLRLCRRRGLRVVGINSEPDDTRPDRVIERDLHAARLIATEALAHPEALVFVFDGDLHVARDHLPLIVDAELRPRGVRRRRVVVHQNAEPIYWQLAEEGLERVVDVVRIAADCYCVFSATPLVALQSYVLWEQNHAELHDHSAPIWRGERWGEVDLAEQVHEIVHTLARFLEIEHERLDDFQVYTTHDLDFLEVLEADERFSPAMLREIKRHVRRGESYFIPYANIIYLADISLYRAAEEAAHFLNVLLAGFSGERREVRDAFYFRINPGGAGLFRLAHHRPAAALHVGGGLCRVPARQPPPAAGCAGAVVARAGAAGAAPRRGGAARACRRAAAGPAPGRHLPPPAGDAGRARARARLHPRRQAVRRGARRHDRPRRDARAVRRSAAARTGRAALRGAAPPPGGYPARPARARLAASATQGFSPGEAGGARGWRHAARSAPAHRSIPGAGWPTCGWCRVRREGGGAERLAALQGF
ncbi:MAG: hypothetical protein KatS3mg102_1261 [Planctomycetota bacterium]|nr:MAG: hypothetical protein KatS3mg102_1261 [Planctomycetota bacterium]